MELEIHGSKITRKSPDNQKLNRVCWGVGGEGWELQKAPCA